MDEERKAWEQMSEEPDLWYGRFRAYLLMGFKRSVNAVHTREPKKNQEKTRTNAGPDWYNVAKTWKWEERARAYDVEQERERREKEEQEREEYLKAVKDMLKNHIHAKVEISATSQIQAAKLLLEYYATSGEIALIKDELYSLQETLKSLGAEL